jgi:cell division septum initiation protein DivIVA
MNAEEVPAPPEGEAEDSGIGERVNAVFTAAEKAAQHMVAMAREEGDDIRRQARAEADALAKQLRLEADREVERILADAREQGEAVIEEGRVAARRVEDDARIRRERLREEIRLLEERIAWAHEGLREVTLRLFPGDAESAESADSETDT